MAAGFPNYVLHRATSAVLDDTPRRLRNSQNELLLQSLPARLCLANSFQPPSQTLTPFHFIN